MIHERSGRVKRIRFGEPVPVSFTLEERGLIVEHTFADPEFTEPLERATVSSGKLCVNLSLDDVDELMGYVAFEANHTEDQRLRRRLDRLFERLQNVLLAYEEVDPSDYS
jgi:hypothetical protein